MIGTVGSNGYQQLELEVTVETMQADGQDYKLCLDEIASIALFDRSGMKIPFLCGDGIDSGSGNVWRTNLKPNDFIRANESLMATEGQGPQPAAPRGAEDRTIRLQMFLHRRGASTSEVFTPVSRQGPGDGSTRTTPVIRMPRSRSRYTRRTPTNPQTTHLPAHGRRVAVVIRARQIRSTKISTCTRRPTITGC